MNVSQESRFFLLLVLSSALQAQTATGPWTARASLAELEAGWFYVDGLEFDASATLLRSNVQKLRDPHFFAPIAPPAFCPDITDNDVLGQPNTSVNNQIAAALNNDANGDGFLDASPLWQFQSALSGISVRRLDTANGQCTVPVGSTTCALPQSPTITSYAVQSSGADQCFSAPAGTTGGYTPAVASVLAPCFYSPEVAQANLELNGLSVPLYRVRTAGNFTAAGAGGLVMTRGFLRESDANALLIPANVPLIGGRPLSALLKGGQGSCASGNDKDVVDGVSGWWFYLESTLAAVPITPSQAR